LQKSLEITVDEIQKQQRQAQLDKIIAELRKREEQEIYSKPWREIPTHAPPITIRPQVQPNAPALA
jgi:hypothetical protein